MLEGVDGYRSKQSLGETDFEREVVFAHRWARRGGRETIYLSDRIISGARECLGSDGVAENGVGDNVSVLVSAIGKLLHDKELKGVGLDLSDVESGQIHLVTEV